MTLFFCYSIFVQIYDTLIIRIVQIEYIKMYKEATLNKINLKALGGLGDSPIAFLILFWRQKRIMTVLLKVCILLSITASCKLSNYSTLLIGVLTVLLILFVFFLKEKIMSSTTGIHNAPIMI